MKKFILCLTILAALNTAAIADTMLGTWENGSNDGWIDWSNAESIDSTTNSTNYSYGTIGATDGSSSLKLVKSGWNQSLALKLNYSQRVAFMSSTTFSIDVTVPADSFLDGTGGYAQIYNLTINAEGYGWNDQFTVTPALNFYFWNGSSQRTLTLTLDYSSILSSMTEPVPGYIEIILTTNADSNRGTFYFDNAKLSGVVPEPATLALLGLGLALLRKRK